MARVPRILLVCRCNICRSPMACAVARQWLAQAAPPMQLVLDSAGTHGWLRGAAADPRALATLARHGYVPQRSRARAVTLPDFARYDQILAMDNSNLADLQRLCPPQHAHKLALYLALTPQADTEIPDPYFGGPKAFERVVQLCEAGAAGLLQYWNAALDR